MNTVPDSRIMLYAGDVDMACNFLGGEMFADALNLPVRSPIPCLIIGLPVRQVLSTEKGLRLSS